MADKTIPEREIRTTPLEWLTGSAAIVAWFFLMGHLLFSQIIPWRSEAVLLSTARDPAELVKDWTDIREYMIVRNGVNPVGASSLLVIHDPKESIYRVDFRLGMRLNLLGRAHPVDLMAAAELDKSFHLARFSAEFDATGVKGRADGQVSGSELYLALQYGANSQPLLRRLVLDRPISLLEAVTPAATRAMEITPGAEYSIPVVDPVWSMEHGTMSLQVREPETLNLGSDSFSAFPVDVTLQDFRTRMYVDKDGTILRRTILGTYTLDSASEAMASAVSGSDALKKQITIRSLSAADYQNVEPTSLRGLAPGKGDQSPLGMLRRLTP